MNSLPERRITVSCCGLLQTAMRIHRIWTIILSLFLLGAPLFAQSRLNGNSPSGTAPAVEASAGYVYMSTTSSSSPHLNLTGIDANGVMQFNPRWGAMLDFTFARAANVPGTGHSDRVFSALIGPEFFPIDGYRGNVFVHGLVGVAMVDSAVLTSPTTEISGYETRFSYALGAGAELTMFGPFAVRLTADYQRTAFVNALQNPEPQNNVRATASLVYRFGFRKLND